MNNIIIISLKLIVFISLLLYIMNPYTIIGSLGVYSTLIICLFSFKYLKVYFSNEHLILLLSLASISIYAVYVSYVYDIFQFNHLRVTINIAVYIIFSIGLFNLISLLKFKLNDVFYYIVLVLVINSIVIMLEVILPSFRFFIESFFIPSGNVDWSDGFRYRGLASAGGASLSITIAAGFSLVFHLYKERYLNLVYTLTFLSIYSVSIFFIGRTGIVLLPIVVFVYLLFSGGENLIKFFVLFFLSTIVLFAMFDEIKGFVISMYGESFYNYAFGFLLDGKQGVENDGTVSVLFGFLQVVPKTFPEILTGVGFYGGSDFYPWTDSGYPRMFLSVGFLFGLIYYFCFFKLFIKAFNVIPFIFSSLSVVLLISEFKEPMLMTGYVCRIFIFISVVSILHMKDIKVSKSMAKSNSLREGIL